MVGYLSPDGNLYEWDFREHLKMAKVICYAYHLNDFINKKIDTDFSEVHVESRNFIKGLIAEDLLMDIGYIGLMRNSICFRAKKNIMTDSQIEWISKNKDSLNEEQMHDLLRILNLRNLHISSL